MTNPTALTAAEVRAARVTLLRARLASLEELELLQTQLRAIQDAS